jgi:hypothetical protein
MAVREVGDTQRHQPRRALQRLQVEQAGAPAEALVGLLQRDQVGAELGDDGDGARRVEATIRADALVQVPGGDAQLPRPRAPARPCGGGALPVGPGAEFLDHAAHIQPRGAEAFGDARELRRAETAAAGREGEVIRVSSGLGWGGQGEVGDARRWGLRCPLPSAGG